MLLALLAGCAGPASRGAAGLGPGDIVTPIAIEPGAADNEHPWSVSPDELFHTLSPVKIRGNGPKLEAASAQTSLLDEPMFQPKDLTRAAIALSNAFAIAKPGQDVMLRLVQIRPGRVVDFMTQARVTTARLFKRDGQLNAIFGVIDAPHVATASYGTSTNPKSVTPTAPINVPEAAAGTGSRQQPRRLPLRLVLPATARPLYAERDDWIGFSLSAPPAASASGSRSTTDEEPAAVVTPKASDGASPDIAARLRQLRALRDEGLIDEDTWRETVRTLVRKQY